MPERSDGDRGQVSHNNVWGRDYEKLFWATTLISPVEGGGASLQRVARAKHSSRARATEKDISASLIR